jgi:hypothetical protein
MPSRVHDSGMWMKKSEFPERFSSHAPYLHHVVACDEQGRALFVTDSEPTLADAVARCEDANEHPETWPDGVACYKVRVDSEESH